MMDVRGLVDAAEGLDRDAELATVVERRGVVMGNTGGARVQIQIGIERGFLRRRADLLAHLSAADSEATSPRPRACLEDLALVPELAQLVSRGQPGDAGARG